MMGDWIPVVPRSDGAWIGIMPDGEIGVGVESEGRASLKSSSFIPMWPFLERPLDEFAELFTRSWDAFAGREPATPEKLVEATVSSAWSSGRGYWMKLAAERVLEMRKRSAFGAGFLVTMIDEMAESETLSLELRGELRRQVR